ncbi:MAG TPA: transporter substrate-binding domain-containing protein [Rhodocyclaceae bacterium]|nr:transporter substrate-binding domain-containing protein [Rhodocyclaceae bacterium]
MNALRKFSLTLLFSLTMSAAHAADDKTLRLTSLDWPPYTGESLKDKGASAAVVKEAFKAVGYTVIIEFYPWSRAVRMVKDDPGYQGYFPEYYSDDTAKEFTYSAPMGSGPLGFAENVDNPIVWNTLDDLSKYRIGVVQDYVNTAEFDKRVAQKKLKVDTTVDDTKNLLKVNGKRIDLAVVDKNVFNYLLKTSGKLSEAKHKLRFNPKILEDKTLYICFKKGAAGERYAQLFAEGLKKINIDAIMASHLK